MRRLIAICMLIVLCLSMSGCNYWADGYYVSVTPHPQQDEYRELGELYASSFSTIRDALSQLIADGASKGIIFLSDLSEDVARSYMSIAIQNLRDWDPVAAYAVESVQFEVGTNTGRSALAVEITYRKSQSEIMRIKRVDTMDEAVESIGSVLEQAGSTIVLRIDTYKQTDFSVLVQRYADENPDKIMETPQVLMSVYPEQGRSRVVELTFIYQMEAEELLHMMELVWPVFTAAELYVQGGASAREKYSQLYSFLMERYEYEIRSSVTPTYSLLQEGIGDSRAFACVYGAMCRKAGLLCDVIAGFKDGIPWYWNRIQVDNVEYYVDLIDSNQYGMLTMRSESEMGNYIVNPGS